MNGNLQNAAIVAVELVLVLAMIGLLAYAVVHDPKGDTAKGLLGAFTVAFGLVINHLFGPKAN